ncbi:MAG: RIP metalloprotease RseP [Planctomycetes bacterium]|jgi:regulator of sigma E protease|nr:RIP metalloprotease RseP [Planctomycetota bacterium]HPY75703.1 RIP metalloprotease RseP [Planctomycetota bacterium]HQB01252.1 RIP metalloprotease RseP [Planctomycetota bacterium]
MKYRFLTWIPVILGVYFLASLQSSLGWLVVLIGIGFLIFVHELGHFLAAKWEGVRVLEFALGFGPAILKKKYKETVYRLNILPLGGYVQMAGETPSSENTGAPDEFMSKSPGARARVIVAGVTMNFVFGLLGCILAFQIGIQFPSPTIGNIMPGSPAWHARLQEGDKIISIDGKDINNFKEIKTLIAFGDSEKGVHVKVERKGEVLDQIIKPVYNEKLGMLLIGVNPYYETLSIDEGTPFFTAGLRTNDIITGFAGKEIENGFEIFDMIHKLEGENIVIDVERDGQKLSFTVTPPKKKVFRIGIEASSLSVQDVRQDSFAAKNGFVAYDKIVAIDGEAVYTSQDFQTALQGKTSFSLTIERGESQFTQDYQDVPDDFFHDFYFVPNLTVGGLVENSPAASILEVGDVITGLYPKSQEEVEQGNNHLSQGKILKNWEELLGIVSNCQGETLAIAFSRNGIAQEVQEITPQNVEVLDFGTLGFLPKKTELQKHGILESCRLGILDAKQMILDIFLMLKSLFSRQISTKNLGGPIVIFTASHNQLQLGFGYFLYFLAIISINLAVINLFPIPILDGGYLFTILIEKIIGRKIPDKVLEYASYLGIALLISLMLYVTYNDILRVLGLL